MHDARQDPEWMAFCQALGRWDERQMTELESIWERRARTRKATLRKASQPRQGRNQERDVEIYRLREMGLSFPQIGERFGINRGHAANIYYRECERRLANNGEES